MDRFPLPFQFCGFQRLRSQLLLVSQVLIFLLAGFATMVAFASEIENLQKELTSIDVEVGSHDDSDRKINEALKKLAVLQGKVDAQTATQESLVKDIKAQLDSLGEGTSSDPLVVKEKRAALKVQLQNAETALARHKVLSIAVTERHKDLQEKAQTLFKKRLLSRGPTIVELLLQAVEADALMTEVLSRFILTQHGLDLLSIYDFITLAVWLLLAGVVAYWVRKTLKQWSSARRWGDVPFDIFSQALMVTLVRYLPRLIISIVLAIYVFQFGITIASAKFVQIVAMLLPPYLLSRMVVEMVLYPRPPARRVLQVNDDAARYLKLWFKVFMLVVLLGAVGFWSLFAAQPPELTLLLARDAFVVLCVPLAITLLLISNKIKALDKFRMIRVALGFVLLVSLVFELLGFRNFSFFVLRALFSLSVLYGMLKSLHWLANQIANVLESDNYAISRAIKRTLGLKPKQRIPGLIAFNFFIYTTLWVLFLYAALNVLDFSDDVIVTVQNWFVHGFVLGNLTINPVRILFAIMSFSAVYVVSGWLKSNIEQKWLAKAEIDRGAHETIVTIIGYLGVTIALLVGLSIAGVTFTNLAIIAGALSVGIGFGLQNIVNNFVSGLILLFERPIKRGDWIVVGNTEGYVKKISIRSTQIQTFDRSDVIVPNSDLISNQVTNWMLYDQSGRLRLPIGVAYGSDTEKVKNILLDLANSHEEVIKDNDEYPIRALFLGFGDSSLNFELRCHIRNIDKRLTVLSDLNYKLDAMFREHNVEIPFPQRDIHIRSGGLQGPREEPKGETTGTDKLGVDN